VTKPVFVIVVNYRTPSLAVACLRSVAAQRDALRGGKIILVDNRSEDDSLAIVARAIEDGGMQAWAELLPLPRNGGFAYGNNAGVRRARALCPDLAAVVLLNPDAIADPGCIGALIATLESRADIGIVGGAISSAEGMLERAAHRWPSPLGELEGAAQMGLLSCALRAHVVSPEPPLEATPCDWVSGACLAIRREVLDAVGELDEGYFLYFEEVDFCRRARQVGWICAYVPEARVVHLEGAATGIRAARRRRPAYWYASRRRFFVKCYGFSGLIAGDVLWAIGRASLTLRRALRLGGSAGRRYEPSHYALDLLGGDLLALLRGELRGIPRLTSHA